jgi:hypothetical protein
MTVPPTRAELETRLARCRELLREFPTGSIPQMLHDMEDELREQLRDLNKP